ncbi:MAG: hypothetical protein JJ858_04575 [Rhizobiaceae bacterium]|nr:hypothetical protein [Rhizobiaceae bacterium]
MKSKKNVLEAGIECQATFFWVILWLTQKTIAHELEVPQRLIVSDIPRPEPVLISLVS